MKDENPFFVSKRNKRGIVLFLMLALIVVFSPRVLLLFKETEKFSVSRTEIKDLQESSIKALALRKTGTNFLKKSRYRKPRSKFDPNTYSEKEWIALGLSKKQVAVVLKYTQRGIYSNEQLEKIFVIPAELYSLIEDSTFYPSKKETITPLKNEGKVIQLVELNTADQEKLEGIPGIGSFFAKNILKYRDRLGGFLYKEQLLEVWKMDVDKYSAIEKYIQVDANKIKQLELNTVAVEMLKDHPYLNWNIANSIIKIRSQKGKFKSIGEIKESVLMDEELFEKIKPYLSL